MCVESRKMVQMILLQSRSRDADVENKRMDTKWKGVGGAGSLGLTRDTNDTVDKIDG